MFCGARPNVAQKIVLLQVLEELAGVGVAADASEKILAAMGTRSLEDLEALLGPDNAAVADLRQLFTLAEAYGMADWLVFDASVVRGLSYYTGAPPVLFPCFFLSCMAPPTAQARTLFKQIRIDIKVT